MTHRVPKLGRCVVVVKFNQSIMESPELDDDHDFVNLESFTMSDVWSPFTKSFSFRFLPVSRMTQPSRRGRRGLQSHVTVKFLLPLLDIESSN